VLAAIALIGLGAAVFLKSVELAPEPRRTVPEAGHPA
jgi:hypothetical protein